ncbi:MAG: formate--tetrahydrofolate ligase [Bryobacteraceae bacterium]|nr:formate--tetrahydrofolate ligase [Bryobacteraceae bacterium]
MMTDLQIARATKLRPINDVAARLGIPDSALLPYGRFKAKIDFDFIRSVQERPDGALVLVTGISPTPAGEGKTTTAIGLGDALSRLGCRAAICLREPSLGPCFGVKGGATGGGRAQVAPMEEINLHFTGDFHAVSAANNLLAAMVDNHLHWGNSLDLDPCRVTWRRAIDLNDRALRATVCGLGGVGNGPVREDGFDIAVASEVMAVLCLAGDLKDLQSRLGRMVVGYRRDGSMVTAADLKADGAMAALLREAMQPNLVQTLEGTPALIHGGPFANIAHGCNSIQATRLGMKLADVVVTEAGFGADLGGEKFLDIKCRAAGIAPACCVVVATVRALKMHGGLSRSALDSEDIEAVERGLPNLIRHVENMARFGIPVLVALNKFETDTPDEIAAVERAVERLGTQVSLCSHWSEGGAGAIDLAHHVLAAIDSAEAHFTPLYPNRLALSEKIRCVAREIYGAADVTLPVSEAKKLTAWEKAGFGDLPVCIAKTPFSFSADPKILGAPSGHTLPVREVRLAAGAGFVVAICGKIMTMPGLPRHSAAESIGLDADGQITGIF